MIDHRIATGMTRYSYDLNEFERAQQHRVRYKNRNLTHNPKWYQRIFKRNRVHLTASQWERDLTRECVESNPGPSFSFKEAFGLKGMQAMQHFTAKNRIFNKWFVDTRDEYKYITNFAEAYLIFLYMVQDAKTRKERLLAFTVYMKNIDPNNSILFNGFAHLLLVKFEQIFIELQSESEESTFTGSLREVLDKYERVKGSLIFRKLYKFSMYVLSLSVFEKMGLTMDNLQFSEIEQEAMRRKYYMGPDFLHCVVDTLVFVCERGQQFLKTGHMDSIFHDSTSYANWYAATTELTRKSKFLGNPEPHGFSKFEYLADLREVIDQGECMSRYAKTMDPVSKRFLEKALGDMKLLGGEAITKRSAQKSRAAPFAILLAGGSSVAKSTLSDVIFTHHGKLFGLPTESEFMYTRNHCDEFWVGFTSIQWCVRMDDIAFLAPDKAPQGDPSMLEMLQVVNSIPFVPSQAALEDKGRTPMLSRLVIATTNTEDLNVNEYFSCPLAIRRRLPFVVTVEPKFEYSKHEGTMIDGDKLPTLQDGEYPDFWDLTVRRVVPNKANSKARRQYADTELVGKFTSIYTFMAWYSKVALEFNTIQDKELDCKSRLSRVSLCPDCHVPTQGCVCDSLVNLQHDEEETKEELDTTYADLDHYPVDEDIDVSAFLIERERRIERNAQVEKKPLFHTTLSEAFQFYFAMVCYRIYFSSGFLRLCLTWCFGPLFICRFAFNHTNADFCAYVFKHMGNTIHKHIGSSRTFRNIALSSAAILVAFKTGSYAYSWFSNTEKEEEIQFKVSTEGLTPKPVSTERENVWYKDDYLTTSFDVSQTTSSRKGLSFMSNVSILAKNCVSVNAQVVQNGVTKRTTTSGVCLAGHIYMFNNHGIPAVGECMFEVVSQLKTTGVSTTARFKLVESQIRRYPKVDLCFVEIKNLPPRANIVDWFMQESLRGVHKGVYITRTRNGDLNKNVVNAIKPTTQHMEALNTTLPVWIGQANALTEVGDCGSLLVSDSPKGPIILGIHVFGSPTMAVGAVQVSSQFLNGVLNTYDTPIIQSGRPNLDSPSTNHIVEALHSKSTVRFISEGTAEVYGSFNGFRARGKSSVKRNLLCESMLNRGFVLRHGAPVMNGWAPWRLALQDMVNPVAKIDQGILDHCVATFTSDILSKLSPEHLATVEVYNTLTAINGAPGVTYVDKVNRSTSAGFPWGKSKKFFIEQLEPQGGILDPITFTPEVMDRVEQCEETYKRGQRYVPVFTGHLKDEATVFSKIARKKTRVFTGAPLDYSIVVRKYLLSVIRVMQNNRFVFECGPGTIAQSLEWSEIHAHITKFGKERMVAGDYKAFDKSMPASIILAAFQIIFNLCKEAGYTEEQLRVVQGIAEDTAFPVIDFNGDLMSFYGSNPSGHPLTVIINGLANSLYLRYCYATLSPDGSAVHFQRDVAVMTYGDDNVMGVSERAPFFTHTSVQSVLADVGITYTMADKEAVSIPYINIDEVSFLKRVWRWDEDIGALVAPLERASIEKMLMINVESKSIPAEAQSISTVASAIREYFWYGKQEFAEKRSMLQEMIDENQLSCYADDSTLPTWDELYVSFWDASKHIVLG